jgi:hypothetical protein
MTVALHFELPDEAFERRLVEYRGGGSSWELTDRALEIRHVKTLEAVALMKAQASGIGEPKWRIDTYPQQVSVCWEGGWLSD